MDLELMMLEIWFLPNKNRNFTKCWMRKQLHDKLTTRCTSSTENQSAEFIHTNKNTNSRGLEVAELKEEDMPMV